MYYKKVTCPVCGGSGHILCKENYDRWHSSHPKFCEECGGQGYRFVRMTNAEHIRAMSDEDLAEQLLSSECCTVCDYYKDGLCEAYNLDEPQHNYCVAACLKWLRQPVKEDRNG